MSVLTFGSIGPLGRGWYRKVPRVESRCPSSSKQWQELLGQHMRLFLDSNIMTYIALFEGYLCDGTKVEFDLAVGHWRYSGGNPPDLRMLHEIEALRILYLIDDQAHFDWLFSEMGLDEILRIRRETRRSAHYHLIDRLIEHRHDVYVEEGRNIGQEDRAELLSRFFPNIPVKMKNDALQYCEAELVESDYFLTNDRRFIKKARASTGDVQASKVSELPFVAKILEQSTVEGQ